MVLPTIIYGLSEDQRIVLLQNLSQISQKVESPFQVQIYTNDIDEAIEEIRNQKSIALVVLGIDSLKKDKDKLALRLGKYAMMINRDHYVVYVIKEPAELGQILPFCTRSAGILICPPEEKAISQTFTPLFEDYKLMYSRKMSEDGHFINLKADGKMFRVCLSDICTIQAVNKTIEFRTAKKTYQIYSSMGNVEKMLDDTFIRCHRSYFINRNHIQYIDFREMIVYMMDGSQVPLARSFKEKMQDSLTAEDS